MAIQAFCEECAYTFSVGEQHAGKRGRCPGCGAAVTIPSGNVRMSRSAPALPPAGSSRSGNRPKSSKSSGESTGSNLLIALAAGGGAILVTLLVVGAFVMGRSSESSTPTPVEPVAQNPAPTNPNPLNSNLQLQPLVNTTPQPNTTLTNTPNNTTTTPPKTNNTSSTEPKATGPELSLADLIEKVEPSVVRIDVEAEDGIGNGSGFVVDKSGIIATNYHVIAGSTKVRIVFADKTSTPAVGYMLLDQKRDIAILKVEYPAEKLHPLPLAEAIPRKGESVIACGSPYGLSFTTSEGIISAIRDTQEMQQQLGTNHEGTWIQTTTPISPGNSGGPLINRRGEVVAANTMQLTVGQNLNFGISSIDIRDALAKAKSSNSITPIAPSAAPAEERSRPQRQPIVDGRKSEQGQKVFGELDEITLMVATFSFDPTGTVEDYVLKMSKTYITQAGMEVGDSEKALMIVTMELAKSGSAVGARGLEITAHVLVRTEDENGRPVVMKVWEGREDCGTFSATSLAQGKIPARVRTQVTTFFKNFAADKKKAAAALEKKEG